MKDLKILIAGSEKVFSIENFYSKYMRLSGAQIERFNAYNIFFDYYHSSILHKIIFKAGLSLIYKKINAQFLQAIKKNRPDVIWVFKGMEIFPASLQWARSENIRLVNYNPDNPFIFSGKGSGNQNVTDSIALYDLHLTYDMGIRQELETKFGAKTAMLPFGFDDNDQLYQESCSQPEVMKACFLGNPDSKRAAFIETLAANGITIDVYGNNWNKFVQHKNITLFPPAYGTDQWKVLYRYRAQLNLMRKHNDNSHNMRSFEVPGIGGIMVAPDTMEHRLYFENGKEAFLYKDAGDCIGLINKLLSMDAGKAIGIRLAARKRSIISGYSYQARAKQALNAIESLFL